MTRNIGSVDRAARIVVGIVLLLGVVLLDGQVRWFGLFGLVPLLTGLAGNCPLYSVFGVSSCRLARPKM